MKFIRDKQNKKTVVAMSGGVDSSAAALLLKKQGYEVIGMFMRLAPLDMKNYLTGWSVNEEDNEAAARRVCQKLNIKFYPINLTQEFRKEVMDYFLDSYAQGLTPNPCVKCNQFIKFNGLLKLVEKLGADYLATGHYARLRREIPNYKSQIPNKLQNIRLMPSCHSRPLRRSFSEASASGNPGDSGRNVNNRLKVINLHPALAWIPNPRPRTAQWGRQVGNDNVVYKLCRGKDENKDQSYFLYNLTQRQLARVLFPLGDYAKEEVRKIADRAKLPYLTKESQDICFLKGDHNDFLRQHLKLKPGPIILETEGLGKVIGKHQGLPLYTIGQRRGVEIGGIGPFYAAKCDYKTNTLYVVSGRDDPALYSDELIAKDVNWLAGQEPKLPLACETVIRYRHKPVKCIITVGTGQCPVHANKYLIKFNKAQRAITPGQSAVFYKGDELLGGGVIQDTTSI
ncbi:MAG: tRNA-specific 2-thiouridylase [bacterium]|nr:tRNA-specific 2-thiouridylase [bacterium]